MTRDEALEILHEHVQNENLRKHAYAVEAAMRAYARKLGEDEEYWGVVGLLHDFDWEIHPTLEEHPQKGGEILRARGADEALIADIQAHARHTGVPRDTPVRQTLFAVDELAGFIVACALVRTCCRSSGGLAHELLEVYGKSHRPLPGRKKRPLLRRPRCLRDGLQHPVNGTCRLRCALAKMAWRICRKQSKPTPAPMNRQTR